MVASKRYFGIAQWRLHGSGSRLWGLRALQGGGGCSFFLCWKSDWWEHFPALASPSVLLSAGWNDAEEQKFIPAINRVRACDTRGRRADAALIASTGMSCFKAHLGMGKGALGKKIKSRIGTAEAARNRNLLYCHLKSLTPRFSSWSTLGPSAGDLKEEADSAAVDFYWTQEIQRCQHWSVELHPYRKSGISKFQ